MAEANSTNVSSNAKKPSQAEIDAALALMAKVKDQRAKQRERAKNDPKAQERSKKYAERSRVRNQLLIAKATKAGITVTDKEIEDYLKAKATA